MKTLDEVIELNEKILKFASLPEDDTTTTAGLALHYLKILKAKSEEPLDNIHLDFHRLAEMIGEPVYIKDQGCKGHWEIITAVRKNLDGEDYAIRGNDRWQRIGKTIYRTKEDAEQ